MFERSSEAGAISAYAKERGVSRLVHFTPFLNLLGIFTTGGIMPKDCVLEYARSHQDEDLLAYIRWNDALRLDRRTDCVNLSIQRINEPLLRRFKANFPQGEPWCIIEIDPVCLQKDGVLFAVANAAATAVRIKGTRAGLLGLKALFAESVTVPKAYGVETCRRDASMARNRPTSIQAEVLFPGTIPLSLIRGLLFETCDGAARARAMLQNEVPKAELPEIKVVPSEFAEHSKEGE